MQLHTLDLRGCGYSADYLEGDLLVDGFKGIDYPTFAFVANLARHIKESSKDYEITKEVDLTCPILLRGLENYCDGDKAVVVFPFRSFLCAQGLCSLRQMARDAKCPTLVEYADKITGRDAFCDIIFHGLRHRNEQRHGQGDAT